jgi:hypothetical protein
MRPDFGWHLPPGVTDRDIDRATASDDDPIDDREAREWDRAEDREDIRREERD